MSDDQYPGDLQGGVSCSERRIGQNSAHSGIVQIFRSSLIWRCVVFGVQQP